MYMRINFFIPKKNLMKIQLHDFFHWLHILMKGVFYSILIFSPFLIFFEEKIFVKVHPRRRFSIFSFKKANKVHITNCL